MFWIACFSWVPPRRRASEPPALAHGVGGFGESSPLRTSTSIRLSVQLFRNIEPTSFLAVWACVDPPSVMQHTMLLGRESWMGFNTRSYRALPPRRRDKGVFGQLTSSHHATTGASTYDIHPTAKGGGFHIFYDGAGGLTMSDQPQLLENLARSNGSPALIGQSVPC